MVRFLTLLILGLAGWEIRSSLYAYDGLQRLVNWQIGQLSGNNDAITSQQLGTPNLRSIDWTLDSLGNCTGNSVNPYGEVRRGDFDGDGYEDIRNYDHVVNNANQVTERYTGNFDNGTPIPNPAYTYDPNGNLAYDEEYVYQYDAWNRLIQVNEEGTLPPAADGRITHANQLGALVCRYSYDGLGRLIRKETPVSAGVTALQVKDLYYDGVRRIQETIARPPVIQQQQGAASNPQADPTGGAGTFQTQGPVANDEQPLAMSGGLGATRRESACVGRGQTRNSWTGV